MPDVSAVIELVWNGPTDVSTGAFGLVWGRGTDVQSLGGTWTPGAPPVGGTPISPNTDADFVIGPGPFYFVAHSVTVQDLRDSTTFELQSMTLSCDEGSVCWTLNASGQRDLFQRFTTGDVPVIEITINGWPWRFVIEGVRRSRAFNGTGVDITGRSLSILAGEPYQFPQNWVNDGPTTAQQLASQAQVYSGLEVDWQIDDWLIPDSAFTFTGSPLAVLQRVAESVAAVVRADRVENRVELLPRYPFMPNEWREEVPVVEIHLDIVMADSYERADKPAFDGIFVSGQVEGALAHVYLAGTMGDKLAPMVTDQLLTEQIALRQRGQAELGKGGPQAVIQITLPVLDDAGFPGVFELNWLCRIIEPDVTWYGIVRAVTVTVAFGKVSQTITLERHTADITGTINEIPAPEPPPDTYLAWRTPITSPTGAASAYESNSGSGAFDGSVATTYYAMIEPETFGTVVWTSDWTSGFVDPSPAVTQVGNDVEIAFTPGEISTQTSRGTLLLTATIDGVPVANRLRLVSTEDEFLVAQFVWSSELLP